MISSKDALRQKYYDFSFIFIVLEALACFIAIKIHSIESMILILVLTILELFRVILLQPYFERTIQKFQIFLQVFLLFFIITTYILIKINGKSSHILCFCYVIYLPISFKISNSLDYLLHRHNVGKFEKQLNKSDLIGPHLLNYIMRQTLLHKRLTEFQYGHKEIWNISQIIKSNQLFFQYQTKQKNHNQLNYITKHSNNQQINDFNDLNDKSQTLLNGYQVDTKIIDGKEYVIKDQAFGVNESQKKIVYQLFNDLFLRERLQKKQFSMIDIYYLVFIVEVLKNYQLFDLTLIQIQKGLGIKYQQIISSLTQQVKLKKNQERLSQNEQQIFSTSYYEAIVFDELIVQTEQALEEAVKKKVSLLQFMKQRHINLENLQLQLESILTLRDELIIQITLMIRINEYSSRLYDIYLNYIETLSFSETDIQLERFNRYKKTDKQLFHFNSADACVVFATFNSQKQLKISKISHNFSSLLGYDEKLIINNQVECLMPQPVAEIHSQYILNFFERGDTKSNLKNSLLFALTKSNHIIPVQIDIKVNMIQIQNEFGITSLIQNIQNQQQYILIDAARCRLVSMTQELNQFVFPNLKNFNKVNALYYFPFLEHFQQNYTNQLSNPHSRVSSYMINSLKTQQLQSNKSIKQTKKVIGPFKSSKYIAKTKKLFDNNTVKESAKNIEQKQELYEEQYILNNETSIKNPQIFDEQIIKKFKNLSYLLIVNMNSQNTNQKQKIAQGISDHIFFRMTISLQECASQGLENLKYLEISKIKKINPVRNAKFIKSVFNNYIEGYETNLHYLNPGDIQCILSELEIHSIKEQSTMQENKGDSFEYENPFSKQENDFLNVNDQVLYNRFSFNDQFKSEQDKLLYSNKQFEKEYKYHNSHTQKDNSQSYDAGFEEMQSLSKIEIQINHQINSQTNDKNKANIIKIQSKALKNTDDKKLQNTNQFDHQHEQRSFQLDQEKQFIFEDKQQNIIDNSTMQFLKGTDADNSVLMQGNFVKQYPQVQDLNESHVSNSINYSHLIKQKYNDISNFDLMNLQNMQSPIDSNKGNIPYNPIFPVSPISPVSPIQNSTFQTSQAHAKFLPLNNEYSEQNLIVKQIGQNNQNSLKVDIFSPKEQSSHQLMNKSTAILSPSYDNFQSQQQFIPFNMNKDNRQQSHEIPEQKIDDIVKKKSYRSIHKQNTMSVYSLSKKRKKIEILHKKEIKNIKDVLDQSSNHSRESSSSSNVNSTKSIILQKTTLKLMKIINYIGLSSFIIISIVVLQQYFSMNSMFNQFQLDLDYVSWATRYQIGISLVMKHYNYFRLIDGNYVVISSDAKVKQSINNATNANLIRTVNDVSFLLDDISKVGTERYVMRKMVDTNYIFKQGSALDRSLPILGQTYYIFNLIDQESTIYTGALRIFAYLFRYSRRVGFGIPEWIVVNNSEQIVKYLQEISQQSQDQSIQQLQNIERDINVVLITIILVSAFCIFIIIPVYSFIQTKREQIIQLFGTFSSQFIDQTINEINKIYTKNNNLKSFHLQIIDQENIKRQNLSSTTRLHKSNQSIIISTILIFLITLPYPILNKTLSSQYIKQNVQTLPSLNMLLKVQAFILDETSLHLFTLYVKQSASKAFNYKNFIPKINQRIIDQNTIYNELQENIQNSIEIKMQSIQ